MDMHQLRPWFLLALLVTCSAVCPANASTAEIGEESPLNVLMEIISAYAEEDLPQATRATWWPNMGWVLFLVNEAGLIVDDSISNQIFPCSPKLRH